MVSASGGFAGAAALFAAQPPGPGSGIARPVFHDDEGVEGQAYALHDVVLVFEDAAAPDIAPGAGAGVDGLGEARDRASPL